jgi:uncharacterized phage-associated protein
MKTHNALAVANWFLARAEAEGKTLDPMKLQKLIYFAHGWSLAITDVPLIQEHPEAWNYGPVIPSVYHKFKSFGRNRITGRATKLVFPKTGPFADLANVTVVSPQIEDDPDAEALLNRVWEVYGPLTGVQLSNMTHAADGAWHRAYYDLAKGRLGVDISDDLIKTEFCRKEERGAANRRAGA